jgi:ankyrin repeat protein
MFHIHVFNDSSFFCQQTPLHLAVITKQPYVVNCLMMSGASIDLVDRNGKTALHLACERGDMASIEVLTRPLRSDSKASEEVRDCVGRMLDAKDYSGKY